MPHPVIDKSKCTNCGKCIEICPMDVFGKDEDGNVVVVKPDECIGCRACEAHCAAGAIKVED